MLTVEVEAKECAGCGKLILKCHHKPSRWAVVKYCGISCSIKDRTDKPLAAWKSETKTCVNCEKQFRPHLRSKKSDWMKKDTCSRRCFSRLSNGAELIVSDIDPRKCVTKGQRVKFLRLSQSACGTKTPISTNAFRSICQMGDRTIKGIEADNPNMIGWDQKVCAALRVPVAILTIPLDKWLAVVKKAGLTAAETTKLRKTETK